MVKMDRTDNFLIYLENEKSRCMEQEQKLIVEERKDEANLCKVEANIYDIYKALYQVSVRGIEDTKEAYEKAEQLFLQKAKAVPANWKKSHEEALRHQDAYKILIEEIKLATVEKIMVEYEKLQEE